jgi:pilus assembly protein CpaF
LRLLRSPNAQSPAGRFPPNLPALSFSTDVSLLAVCLIGSHEHQAMEIKLPDALAKLLAKPGLTDLILNGHLHTYIDVGEGLVRTVNPFQNQQELTELLIELGFETGSRIDMAKPISDFMIGNFRFHAVLGHGVSEKPLVSIRRHPNTQVRLEHLVEVGMLTKKQLDLLQTALKSRQNIVVAGATSAGKTTLLGALIAELNERVVCIEQIPELVIKEPAVSMHERPANQEGLGSIAMQQLVIEALRMRPDRIVVGEVRGSEFGVLLQAMNNGHRGTMATLHCKSLTDLPDRLLMLGMLSGFDRALTEQMVSQSFDLVLQLEKLQGVRTLTNIGRFTQRLEVVEVSA